MTWDLQLETASFRGVEFQVERISDALTRRLAEYRYPGRDGADVDDLGREARRTTLTVVFTGPTYEAELGALFLVVDDGKVGTFVHPVLGTWQARAQIRRIDHGHQRRDTAMVELEIIEDGTGQSLDDLFSVEALITDVEAHITDINELNTDGVTDITDATAEAQSWAQDVKDGAEKAAAAVNKVRAKIDKALATMDRLTNPSNWGIVRSLKRLAYSCQKASTKAKGLAANPVTVEQTVVTPLVVTAQRMYGDGTKTSQLIAANSQIRNPFAVPVGPISVPEVE